MSNYDRLRTYKPWQVLKYVSLNPEDKPKVINFAGRPVFMGSKRYLNFKAHGLTCVKCGLQGEYFALEKSCAQKTNKYHFNLYGTDPETGEEVMLTKDHIKPRAKGGTDTLDNFQVMCSRCNAEKGDNWLSQEQLIHQARIEEIVRAIKSSSKTYLKNRFEILRKRCEHNVVCGKDNQAVCTICGKFLGPFCGPSPTKVCKFSSDICVYCGKQKEI